MGRPWSRRDFLRAAGIGAAASALYPFIPTPIAEASMVPNKLILFSHPDGSVLPRWRSNGTGTAFANGAALPALRGPILGALDAHRANLVLLDGLDVKSPTMTSAGGGAAKAHGAICGLWSGARGVGPYAAEEPEYQWGAAKTIDQILADAATTSTRSLVLGTSSDSYTTYYPMRGVAAYAGPALPIRPTVDPRVAFDALFTSGVDGDTAATRRRRAERRSVLGAVRGELTRLRAELPAIERERLDGHLTGVDDLDRRLGTTMGTACTAGTRPGDVTADTTDNVLPRLRAHFDIVQHAFTCDLTRIANVQLGCETSTRNWAPAYDAGEGVHTWSHMTFDASSEAERLHAVDVMTSVNRVVAQEFSGLIDRLSADPSVFQDTLAVWGTAMSWGGAHINLSAPFVLATASPAVRRGFYHRWGTYELNLDSRPRDPYTYTGTRTPHNRLLVSLLQLMGRTDIEAVGDAGGGLTLDNSPIAELFA